MSNFFMVVQKDDDSSYGVYFPDLPGCYAAGDSQEQVLENARISLRLYVEHLVQDGKPLPTARSLEQLMEDAEVRQDFSNGNGFLMAVPLLYADTKRRVNITLEPSLIAALDEVAEIAGTSRSDILAIAARRYIASEYGAVQVDVRDPNAGNGKQKVAA